jgi:hypothetical protein
MHSGRCAADSTMSGSLGHVSAGGGSPPAQPLTAPPSAVGVKELKIAAAAAACDLCYVAAVVCCALPGHGPYTSCILVRPRS